MTDVLIQLSGALCGSFGFALLCNHKGANIAIASVGGALTWGIYLLGGIWLESLFLLNLIAACFAAVYSEFMARIRKTPATAFLMTSIITLVPGGSLYYTLLYIIADDKTLSAAYALDTLLCAAGIAVGIVIVSVAIKPYIRITRRNSLLK